MFRYQICLTLWTWPGWFRSEHRSEGAHKLVKKMRETNTFLFVLLGDSGKGEKKKLQISNGPLCAQILHPCIVHPGENGAEAFCALFCIWAVGMAALCISLFGQFPQSCASWYWGCTSWYCCLCMILVCISLLLVASTFKRMLPDASWEVLQLQQQLCWLSLGENCAARLQNCRRERWAH